MKKTELPLHDLLAHDAWIHALARRLVRDEPTAEDVVQDAWVAALEHPPRRPGLTRAWLGRVVRNVVRMGERSARRATRREQAVARPGSVPSVAEMLEREQARIAVGKAVLALEEPYRSAILYRYFQNLLPREIARRLEVSPAAVEGRLRRGLDQLRARLDREFGNRAGWSTALLPLLGAGPAGVAVGAGSATGTATTSMANGVAGAAGSAAGSTVSVSLLTGALVMSTKIKIGIAVLLLAGAGLVVWDLVESREQAPENPSARKADPHPLSTNVARKSKVSRTGSLQPVVPPAEPDAIPIPRHDQVPARFAVTGTVRDENGRPLVHAEVRAFVGLSLAAFGCVHSPVMQTSTDADGRYCLGPIERKLILEATYPGLCRQRVRQVPGSTYDFVLGAPGLLTGRVTHGPEGPPCVDAAVIAMRVEPTSTSIPSGQEVLYETLTDDQGHYRFSDLPADRYDVRVYPANAPPTRKRTHEVEVRARETVTRDIVVEPPATGIRVSGRVVDEATGTPVVNARVHLSRNPRRRAVTGEDGRFAIHGLVGLSRSRSRRYHLRVDAAGYVPEREVVYVTGKQDVELEVALEKPARIRGTVKDAAGAPVADARVAVMAEFTRKDLWSYVCRSNAQGTFEKDHRRGRTEPLFASADGFAGGVSEPIPAQQGDLIDNVVIKLFRGGTITGRITDNHGQPLEGIWCYLRSKPGTAVRTGGFTAGVRTGQNGEYRLEHVYPGSYELRAEKWLYREGRATGMEHLTRSVDVADETSYRHDFVFWKGLAISGKVVDDSGAPVPGAHLRAEPQGAATRYPGNTTTDSQGGFRVERLTPGLYTLTVIDRRVFCERFENVAAGQSDLVLRVFPKPRVTGRVVFADTLSPVPRFWVQISPGGRGRTFENEAGRFEIDPSSTHFTFSRSGTYHLEVGTEDGYVTSAPTCLDVRPGKPLAPLELSLVRGGSLSGRVTAPPGKTLAQPVVRVRPCQREGHDPGPWLVADRDHENRYSFHALRPGSYRLEASAKGLLKVLPAITIQAATPTHLDIRLDVGGGIRFQVTDPDGRPSPAEITIESLDPDPALSMAPDRTPRKTDRRGKLEWSGLAPGRYRIQATSKRWVKAERVVTVSAGVDLDLGIQLARGGALHVTVLGPDQRPVKDAAVCVKQQGKVIEPQKAYLCTLFADALQQDANLTWPVFQRTVSCTGSGGTLLRTGLPSGDYRVEGSCRGFAATESPVTIADSCETRLLLTLRVK